MNTKTLILIFLYVCHIHGDEPSCSKFDYDKHMLEMLVRLESEMKQNSEEFRAMKQELDQEISHRKRLNNELNDQIEEYRQLRQMLEQVNHTLTALDGQTAELGSKLETKSPSMVYFFMRYPEKRFGNGKVLFRDITISGVATYDKSTAVLTIAESGLYHVTFTFIVAADAASPFCNLYLNDKEVIHNRGKGLYQTTTAGMYVILKTGDTLDIGCSLWGNIHHGRGTIFTGALIHAFK